MSEKIPSGQHRIEELAASMQGKFDNPDAVPVYPHTMADLPRGAKVSITFIGAYLTGGEDMAHVILADCCGERVRIGWEQHQNAVEDYTPIVRVLDYGFKPGDVATVEVRDDIPTGQRTETLFAIERDGQLRWFDARGEYRSVELHNLTLVVRDGVAVPQED